MIPPCQNCGLEDCHFCRLARTDPRYAALFGQALTPFTPHACTHRGEELGRQKCDSCGGNVEIKVFSCQKHGTCTLEKEVGHKTCSTCPDRRPCDLGLAYDWRDLGDAVPGFHRKFNSSLLRFRDKLILATRIHTHAGWSAGRILLTRLNSEFRGEVETVELSIDHPLGNFGIEDPRLFEHQGKLHIAFTGVQRQGNGMVTHQLYARLNDSLQAEEVFAPDFAGRQPWEKNWGFFSQDGQLYAVYQIQGHKVLKIDGNQVTPLYQSQTDWPAAIGEPRGGAAPIKRGNEWYSFFHDVRQAADGRREYNLCLYTFEDQPPFRVNRIARIPLFSPDKQHRPQDDGTPYVIFPCGAFLHDNLWHVSAGYYDRWSWLLRFDVNRCEELLDIAPGGRDARLETRGACLTPHQIYDVWANVYNRNEYELPDRLDGWRIVDLGGHIGSFARLCLDRGADHVLSVEPLAENCAAWLFNLQDVADRCQLLEGAVFGGEPPATATLGGYSLREVGNWPRVPVKTLHLGPVECDLLKIDVEGAEYEILANTDLAGVRRICGEGHLGEGLPGEQFLLDTLRRQGFTVRTHKTGDFTYLFWAERSAKQTPPASA